MTDVNQAHVKTEQSSTLPVETASDETKRDPSEGTAKDAEVTGVGRTETIPTSDVKHEPTAMPSSSNPRVAQLGLSRTQFEQEVGQVMGSLNSWWGGVKKQSASALSSIKADLDKTVSQAQADLEFLRTAKVEVVRKAEDTDAQAEGDSSEKTQVTDKGKGKLIEPQPETTQGATSIFDRLSSSTSQLQHSLQMTLQNTLASAAANPSLSNPAHLRAQLAENLRLSSAKENLQLSVRQAERMAEEYLKKGDQWVKDAEKWMGDAVKVLPPEDSDTRYIATSWDGGDFYAFSTSSTPSEKVLFDSEPRTPRPSTSAILAGSRKDTLLSQLRQTKELLIVDPQGEDQSPQRREEYRAWLADVWPAESEGGKAREIGNVGNIRMSLVPEHLSDEEFWQRYLFHVHMIEAEEEKRKKLLQATEQNDQPDDFNWDDEPQETSADAEPSSKLDSTTVKDKKQSVHTVAEARKSQLNVVESSTATSPRDSEESYDLVSDQGARGGKKETIPLAASTEEDEDSDWE